MLSDLILPSNILDYMLLHGFIFSFATPELSFTNGLSQYS